MRVRDRVDKKSIRKGNREAKHLFIAQCVLLLPSCTFVKDRNISAFNYVTNFKTSMSTFCFGRTSEVGFLTSFGKLCALRL